MPTSDSTGVQPESSHTDQLLNQLLQQITQLNVHQQYLALGPDKVCEFLYADKIFKVYVPFANHDLIQRFILTRGRFYELPYLKKVKEMIPPKAVIIDAGANIGNHTIFFSRVCGAGRVYSFEPLRETFRILERNLVLNRLVNVIPINGVLGEKPGRAQLGVFSSANIGGTSFRVGDDGEYEMTSIDTLELDRLDFLKIDVEGGHVAVLRGASETIKRCRPLIWIELRQKQGEFGSGAAVLKSFGYRLKESMGSNDHLFVSG